MGRADVSSVYFYAATNAGSWNWRCAGQDRPDNVGSTSIIMRWNHCGADKGQVVVHGGDVVIVEARDQVSCTYRSVSVLDTKTKKQLIGPLKEDVK